MHHSFLSTTLSIVFILIASNIDTSVFGLIPDSEICYSSVGCLSLTEPWYTPLRPFPPPADPDDINVSFYLSKLRNENGIAESENFLIPTHVSDEAAYSVLKSLDFQPNRMFTVFIIHGFSASIESEWMTEMAATFMSRVDANVILVDWGNGAQVASYLQVASNTRIVGLILSRFILFLMDWFWLNPDHIHIVGHSLGGHIAGYAGKSIPNIYRITALDLAQPGFEGHSPDVRLDTSDAVFVDAIHTNGKPTIPLLGLGFMTTIGDVDFYFNGGAHQLSCLAESQLPSDLDINSPTDLMKLPVEIISQYLGCSHSMSIYYFIEAIRRNDCIMWGVQSTPLTGAINTLTFGGAGRIFANKQNIVCTFQTCSPVGLETFAYPARGKFHVTTYKVSEYCIPNRVSLMPFDRLKIF